MSSEAVSTEGRIFVAQLIRDLRAREAKGAGLLSPGSKRWPEAFRSFGVALSKSKSPVWAGKAFRAAVGRLWQAQKSGACFVNAHLNRSRSGQVQLLTWEISKHPLTRSGYEGVVVRSHMVVLQRNGRIYISNGSGLAFLSWHALARMKERSDIDIFSASGIVAGCGFAGLLMRESDPHCNTGLNYCVGNMVCTGNLRVAPQEDGSHYGFFDVLTVLPPDNEPRKADQGVRIALAVKKYFDSDDADPCGYGDAIPVLPAFEGDFVSRTLRKPQAQAMAEAAP
jgi:hypothetical protein